MGGQTGVFEGAETHDGVDVVDVFYGGFEFADLGIGQTVGDDHRKSTFAETFKKFVLTFDGVHAVGEIVKHVVVDTSIIKADEGGNNQHERQHDNKFMMFDNKFFHIKPSYKGYYSGFWR